MTAFVQVRSMRTEHKYNHYDGLDTSGRRPWQMVPYGGEKYLLLTPHFCTIASVSSTNAAVAEAAVVPSHFREPLLCLRGKALGKAQIVLRNGLGQEVGCLDLQVFPEIRRIVKFYLVKDSAHPPHQTKRTAAELTAIVQESNKRILGPQANAYFELPPRVLPAPVRRNLGNVISFHPFTISVPRTPSHRNWHDITQHGDLDPKVFNVFCVWDFSLENWDGFVGAKNRVGSTRMARSGANVNMCIIKDYPSTSDAGLFAHEAVHYLSRLIGTSHSAGDDMLMREEGQAIPGRRLSRADIEGIHEWAAKV